LAVATPTNFPTVACSPNERDVNSIAALQPLTATTWPIDSAPTDGEKLIAHAPT
jgi:hypothetical protein